MVGELVRRAEATPEAGCIGPKCYYYFGDRNRIWSAGGALRFREAVTRERGMGRIDRGSSIATSRSTTSTAPAC